MKLTAKARTAVTAMADLAVAEPGRAVALSEIAERHILSLPFLEQIFSKLRRSGLVESRRGANGGYVLARPADEISASDVVRAIDVEIRSTACTPGEGTGCKGTGQRCLTHGLWASLDTLIDDYLAKVSLAQIASGCCPLTVRAQLDAMDVAPASAPPAPAESEVVRA